MDDLSVLYVRKTLANLSKHILFLIIKIINYIYFYILSCDIYENNFLLFYLIL